MPNLRVAVILELRIGGQHYQTMDARGGNDQFIGWIAIRKIWQAHGIGDNFRGQGQHDNW